MIMYPSSSECLLVVYKWLLVLLFRGGYVFVAVCSSVILLHTKSSDLMKSVSGLSDASTSGSRVFCPPESSETLFCVFVYIAWQRSKVSGCVINAPTMTLIYIDDVGVCVRCELDVFSGRSGFRS